MTVKEIVLEYLKANGYGGLCNDDDCGCHDDDLMPCGTEGVENCEACYKVPVHCDTCDAECEIRDEKGVTHCLTTEPPAKTEEGQALRTTGDSTKSLCMSCQRSALCEAQRIVRTKILSCKGYLCD